MFAFSATLTVTLGSIYFVRSRHLVDDERLRTVAVDVVPRASAQPTVSVRLAHDPATDTDLKIPVLTPDKSVDVSA